jgi:hypothetical protein
LCGGTSALHGVGSCGGRGFFVDGGAIAGDDPVAEGFVGIEDDGGVDGEFGLAGVFGNEFEAELIILEARGAEVAHGDAVALGLERDKIGGVVGEDEFEFVAVVEALAEFVHEAARHAAAFLLDFGHDAREGGIGIFDEFAGDLEALDI